MRSIEEIVHSLPEALAERTRIEGGSRTVGPGQYVIYWMAAGIRVDENPALEVAIATANELELPVFVYQSLSDRYPYASDRHHTFILEGARDVQAAIKSRDVGYVFHLERGAQRDPYLKTLAEQAAVVVTEDMPVEPLRGWTLALAAASKAPVFAVDTACVVPMQLVGKAYDRAFAFRNATRRLYRERLTRPVPRIEPHGPAFAPEELPFEALDLQSEDIADLVSYCEIDHAIGPVADTPGGSTAGYARWERFKRHGLSRYASRRNNALLDGVSRMSAYLHYGMVSPMRLAREAAEADNRGGEKYLDELLIWRELAYNFCFYRLDHDQVTALPDWAIATLREHETDPRWAILSWETMARAKTGDELWDAAQQSLLKHGELHNNVRMTWGKACLNWTRNAEDALARMIDLNHRYALDGRDPASYGGILWCLGQFDRPFTPARAISGTVRGRATEDHAKRLDATAYFRHTTRPLRDPVPRIAVIGAGISGLSCARTLQDHGFEVTVFEKSRGVGGRMATRHTDAQHHFDHGAQYFTARDRRFQRYVHSWIEDGIVQPWLGRIVVLQDGEVKEEKRGTERFVGVPGMNAICKHLAADLTVQTRTRAGVMERTGREWQLIDDHQSDLGRFDAVIVSAPARQTAELLNGAAPNLSDTVRDVEMTGCWAVMLALPPAQRVDFDGAFVHDSPLSWIARNNSKPGRDSEPETWVLHASPNWTRANIDEAAEDVAEQLIDEFWRATGRSRTEPIFHAAHRWRYALPSEPLENRSLFDRQLQVGVCGDWCGGPRVEGAFLSGMAAAGQVLGHVRAFPCS